MKPAGYEAQTGLSAEAVRGETQRAVFGETEGAELKANYTRCVEQRAPVSCREELDIADGARFWETSLASVIVDDDVIRIVGIARNVTEQVERAGTAASEQRLEELTSIVSHDLRNPLNVADGRIELARETGSSDQLVRASDVIDRCQELVDDLLVMAEGGSEVSEMAIVKIADAAERAWQTVQAGPATLEVDSSRRIRADSSRLRQLLEDLYRNSVEHGGDDVTVRVGDVAGGFYVSGPGSSSPVSSVSCDTYSRHNVFMTAPI